MSMNIGDKIVWTMQMVDIVNRYLSRVVVRHPSPVTHHIVQCS